MSQDKEIIDLCIEVFEGVGLKRFAARLQNYKTLPNKESITKLYEEANNWINFAGNVKKRNFIFGNNFSLLKGFVISQSKEYNKKGEPVIVINKLEDETASFKDNPIKNLYIIYEDEEQRDIDFERLLIARN